MTERDFSIEKPAGAMDGASLSEAPGDGHDVGLIDVLTQLAYRKWLIVKVTGIAILGGVILILVLPVRYTAVTKIMPPQQTQSTASMMMSQLSGGGAGYLAAITGGGLGLKNPNDIYLGLLTSRPIADAIIQKFNLASVYHAKDMTAARKKLKGFTEVVSEQNGFISVSVTDRDKKRGAGIANAYTEELRILTKSLAVTEASQRRLFYEEQLKQAKESLVAAELSFQQVQQNKGLVALDAQAKAMIESLAVLRGQVAAKEVEVQALRSYSTDRNPEVELAKRELSSLQAEVTRMELRNHSAGFGNVGLEDVPGAGMEYLRAQHDVIFQQALFDMLMKQYDAAKLDEAKDAAIIQVVEPAIEPDRKSSPKRAWILVLSTIMGFFSGCILALVLWWKEHVQFDPIGAKRLEELSRAIRGPKSASS